LSIDGVGLIVVFVEWVVMVFDVVSSQVYCVCFVVFEDCDCIVCDLYDLVI